MVFLTYRRNKSESCQGATSQTPNRTRTGDDAQMSDTEPRADGQGRSLDGLAESHHYARAGNTFFDEEYIATDRHEECVGRRPRVLLCTDPVETSACPAHARSISARIGPPRTCRKSALHAVLGHRILASTRNTPGVESDSLAVDDLGVGMIDQPAFGAPLSMYSGIR